MNTRWNVVNGKGAVGPRVCGELGIVQYNLCSNVERRSIIVFKATFDIGDLRQAV